MEKRISKGVLSAALILVTSFVCGIIAIAGFLLGDFQAVLYSAALEMCGLFIICIMIDAIQQQIEDFCEMQPKLPLVDIRAVSSINQINYRIMKKNIFVALFAVVCVAVVMVSVTLVNCHRANVMLRKTVISQANDISELGNNQHTESTIMYTGIRK